MKTITLPDELAAQLSELTAEEMQLIEAEVRLLLAQRRSEMPTQEEKDAALDALVGIFDDDITDMSTTVRETLNSYFRDQHGRTD
jgi:hypothetical protein